MLIYWFLFIRGLFDGLMKAFPASAQVDKAFLSQDDLLSLDQSSAESKGPATKFLFDLVFTSFDLYQLILFNIFQVSFWKSKYWKLESDFDMFFFSKWKEL